MGLAKKKDIFEENGLTIETRDVEVGKTYPIFAMITKFLDEQPNKVTVELNFGIQAEFAIASEKQINILKERVFESGIFVSTICSKEPEIQVHCKKVVFGRRAELNA